MKLNELKEPEGQVDKSGPQGYKLFVDLDGVLVDFVKRLDDLMGGGYSEEKYETDPKFRSRMWKVVKEKSEEGVKVWEECDPMPDMKQLWDYIKTYDPEILSATGDPKYGAEEQKRNWVKKYLRPHPKVNIVRKAVDKAKFAKENYILIDDKERALDPWVAAGGIGILHTSAAKTIQELKKLGI